MTGIRREGDAPAAGREDVLLLEKVRRRTLEGKLPARDDILTMLAWKADGPPYGAPAGRQQGKGLGSHRCGLRPLPHGLCLLRFRAEPGHRAPGPALAR